MRRSAPIALLVLLAACSEPGQLVPDNLVLSPADARHLWPSYSPDGSRIAYWSPSATGIGNQLWVADADLTNAVQLPVTAIVGGVGALWSPDGTQLAVPSSEFGTADVVVVPAAGGAVTRVTRGAGIELPLAWFPDGDRIVYLATVAGGNFQSFVVSISRGELGAAVPGERRPNLAAPSPDGTHIGFVVSDGPRTTIWVADSLGRSPRQLTTEGFENPTSPHVSWSPDSKEILYTSRRTGTTDLWVAPIDGSAPRQLTRDIRNDFAESWSPDGKYVAFLSDRGKQTDIWVVLAAGGEEWRVTDSAAQESAPLAWRPGHTAIAYSVNAVNAGIVAMDLADGKERRLTPDSIRTAGFWLIPSPTEFLYFADLGGGSQEMIIAPLAGGAGRVLVERGGSIRTPAWSPDGKTFVYQSDRNGTMDLFTVPAAGGTPRLLVNWPSSDEFNPAFTSDGESVVFTSNRESALGDVWRVAAEGGEPTQVTRATSVNEIATVPGTSDLFIAVLGQRAGQFNLSRVGANGAIQPVWDRSSILSWTVAPAGDSVAAMVEQPDGSSRPMFLSAKGTGGRPILEPGDIPGVWSKDGTKMLVTRRVSGHLDVFTWDRASGDLRQLTKTPYDESGAEFTQDGKSVVFNRTKNVQRIYSVDLTKLLGTAP